MTDTDAPIERTQDGKERQWEIAIAALLSAATVSTAAERVGVSKRTLQRWLRLPDFQAQFRAAKRALIEEATARLRAGALMAVKTLERVQRDPKTPPAARVSAARTLLEMALRAHETEELLERLTTLEEQMGDRR